MLFESAFKSRPPERTANETRLRTDRLGDDQCLELGCAARLDRRSRSERNSPQDAALRPMLV